MQMRLCLSASEKGEVTILHAFTGGSDGAEPSGSLLNVGGVAYGVTVAGGLGNCSVYFSPGCGTVFSIGPQGSYAQIYAFKGPMAGDGVGPNGPLTAVNGLLYGTTANGGAAQNQYYSGILFSLSTQGVETVLHSFGLKKTAVSAPEGALLPIGNTLYGVAVAGGDLCDVGLVYTIGLDGTHETILHCFGQNGTDGEYPSGGLINVGGLLYGTTSHGGSSYDGIVYSLTEQGDETIIYTFLGRNNQTGTHDASGPNEQLLYVDGSLYGTSISGGRPGKLCAYRSCGTIFQVTP